MTSQVENQPQTQQPSDKELNFRALEAKYQRQLADMNADRERLQRELEEKNKIQFSNDDDEDTSDHYIDHKKFKKSQEKLKHSLKNETQSEIQKAMIMAKDAAKEELKQELWLENNPDFFEVLKHADKFAQKAPKLADSILRMPDTFERQKLVYENIKQLELDKPEKKQSSIQDKVNANQRSPYYQPSSVGAAPYAAAGDFSQAGQKNAYAKMQELKNRLRI